MNRFQQKIHTIRTKLKKPTKRHLIIGFGAILGIMIVVQVFFPIDRLLPFAAIDGRHVGNWQKQDVIREFDTTINQQTIPVHRGNEGGVYLRSDAASLGLSVETTSAINQISYPWYMRIVPTSLFWYGTIQDAPDYDYSYDEETIQAFIKDELADCKLAPQNATLAYEKDALTLKKAKNGGVCKPEDVKTAIMQLRPRRASPADLTFAATITPPKIDDAAAQKIQRYLEAKTGDITITAGDKSAMLPYEIALSWLVFDNTKEQLIYQLDQKKADAYLTKSVTPLVTVAPGVTKVTTRDFTELSRTNGAPGRSLDMAATRQSILDTIKGEQEKATAKSVQIAPKVDYTRTYSSSDAGLSALVQQFAEDNKGTFGVQYIELTGKKRRADYNASKQFITASTYKLFVAYSSLKRVESGQWSWNDQVTSGQNLTTCFDKMIVNSDNACAEALYSKIGFQTVINEARGLGLSNTSLDSESQKTSAGDLATLLGSVYSGTIDLNASSRAKLIDAMKRNVYRQGIPSGSSGTVADKVGFLDGLLHDASIVYSPKGDYVLVIMTDGSSWNKIAELTRKIESIR